MRMTASRANVRLTTTTTKQATLMSIDLFLAPYAKSGSVAGDVGVVSIAVPIYSLNRHGALLSRSNRTMTLEKRWIESSA